MILLICMDVFNWWDIVRFIVQWIFITYIDCTLTRWWSSFKHFLNQTKEYILLLKHPLNHLTDNLTSTLEWLENWSRFQRSWVRFPSDLSGGEARVNKEPIMTYRLQYIPTLIDANLSLNWAVGASLIHWQYLKYHDMLNNCRIHLLNWVFRPFYPWLENFKKIIPHTLSGLEDIFIFCLM